MVSGLIRIYAVLGDKIRYGKGGNPLSITMIDKSMVISPGIDMCEIY